MTLAGFLEVELHAYVALPWSMSFEYCIFWSWFLFAVMRTASGAYGGFGKVDRLAGLAFPSWQWRVHLDISFGVAAVPAFPSFIVVVSVACFASP